MPPQLPKYIKKVTWRLMIKAMSREIARFIQSIFEELKMSEARYKDLLSEAIEHYPKYLDYLNNALKIIIKSRKTLVTSTISN
jgi:intergrase/recombinase